MSSIQEKLRELMESKEKKCLDELGGAAGLAASLGSDLQKGILASSEHDLKTRQSQYGENILERKPPPTLLELFIEAMQDTTVVILMIAAVVSIVIGAIVCGVNLGSVCPRRPFIPNMESTGGKSHVSSAPRSSCIFVSSTVQLICKATALVFDPPTDSIPLQSCSDSIVRLRVVCCMWTRIVCGLCAAQGRRPLPRVRGGVGRLPRVPHRGDHHCAQQLLQGAAVPRAPGRRPGLIEGCVSVGGGG